MLEKPIKRESNTARVHLHEDFFPDGERRDGNARHSVFMKTNVYEFIEKNIKLM